MRFRPGPDSELPTVSRAVTAAAVRSVGVSCGLSALLTALVVGALSASALGAQGSLLPGVGSSAASSAPPDASADEGSTGKEEPKVPPASEVIPRSLELGDEAAAAERQIERLEEVAPLGEEARRIEERLAELEPRPGSTQEAGGDVAEAFGGLDAKATALRVRLEGLLEEVSSRLRSLEQIRGEWREERRFWDDWRQQLESQDLHLLDQDLTQARETAAGVLRRAEAGFATVVELQRRVEKLRRRLDSAAALPAAALPVGEEQWRDAPVLGSAEYRRQLTPALAARTLAGIRSLGLPDRAFRRSAGWIVVLQALVALVIGFLLRRARLAGTFGDPRLAPLRHPWVTGVFVALTTMSFLYPLAPASWMLVLWTVLAVCLTALAPRLLEERNARRVLGALAVFLPLLQAAELVRLPQPLLRLLVVVASAALVPVLLVSRRRRQEIQEGHFSGILRRLGAVVVLGVLGLEILGFDAVARWLLRSSVSTALLVFAFVFLLRLGRWSLEGLMSGPAAQRFPALRWVSHLLIRRLLWLIRALLLLLAVAYVISVWGIAVSPQAGLSEILGWEIPLGSHAVSVGAVLLALLALYLGFLLSTLTRAGVDRWSAERGGVDPGVGDSIKRLLHYVVIALGFLLALSLLGFELQNLTIILGALGVGVGFGLQNIVNNFFSGLILLFERPVRVGDVVVLDGEWGTVKKIGLRSTVVSTFDQAEMIVPNSDLVSQVVTNWTLSDRVTRVVIPVGVAYGSDVPRVFRLLREVAEADSRVLSDPAPMILFSEFGDSSLDFELRVWVGDTADRLPTRSDLLAAIDRRFRDEGVEIPFPQRDLHLRSVAEAAAGRLGKPGSIEETNP